MANDPFHEVSVSCRFGELAKYTFKSILIFDIDEDEVGDTTLFSIPPDVRVVVSLQSVPPLPLPSINHVASLPLPSRCLSTSFYQINGHQDKEKMITKEELEHHSRKKGPALTPIEGLMNDTYHSRHTKKAHRSKTSSF
ncbi:hypothetical protein Adt_32780 [Abeliophyllum distichum]|uniref:Uncharacterized protein n=1 Tax=Abeliophyllum distichum TaxID=126358 RepID=A0ABD1QY01_9LAMI